MSNNGGERSPKMVQRALDTYGEALTDPKYALFAKLRSEGKTQYEAFRQCFPGSVEWTRNAVDRQASVLSAHPKMPDMIAARTHGGRNLAGRAFFCIS